ncbi:prephenate dehydrogenase [Mycoplasmatota bacterium zrk1]
MNIGIVGLGLIGGTYAQNLIENHNVYGIDINNDSLLFAEEYGYITKGFLEPRDILGKCDVVIICLYPNQIYDFVKENEMHFKLNAVLTDASGIKSKLVEEVEEVLREDLDFVFAHPVAGRETKGVRNSDKLIFSKGNFVITPTKRNKLSSIELIEKLANEIGFLNVNKLSASEHDEIIAYTSQLTHVIALALVNSDEEKYKTELFIGDSYKDLTRIASINSKLWGELFFGNKEFLVNKLDHFISYLEKYRDCLVNTDELEMSKLMEEARIRLGRTNES